MPYIADFVSCCLCIHYLRVGTAPQLIRADRERQRERESLRGNEERANTVKQKNEKFISDYLTGLMLQSSKVTLWKVSPRQIMGEFSKAHASYWLLWLNFCLEHVCL